MERPSFSVVQRNDAIFIVITVSGETIACDDAVLALGAWSGPLAQALGLDVPLESERGYHLELWNPSVMPKSPVMVASGKFVATPMKQGVRCAGIVELGGLVAGPSDAPFALLRRKIADEDPNTSVRRKPVRETEARGERAIDSRPGR